MISQVILALACIAFLQQGKKNCMLVPLQYKVIEFLNSQQDIVHTYSSGQQKYTMWVDSSLADYVSCIIFAGGFAQQQSMATCDVFDTMINNRNTDRVSQCTRNGNCTVITCIVELSGGTLARTTLDATPCTEYIITASASINGPFGFSSVSSSATESTSLVLTASDTLYVEAGRSSNGISLGVSVLRIAIQNQN